MAPHFDPDAWRPPAGGSYRVDSFLGRHDLADLAALVARAGSSPEWYWPAAFQFLDLAWPEPWHTTLDMTDGPARARWFAGGRTNAAWLSVQRWASDRPDHVALVTSAEDGASRSLTFAELWAEVSQVAGGLTQLGVGPRSAVAVYSDLSIEAATIQLAAAALGAISVPVYSGLSADALGERLRRADATVLFAPAEVERGGRRVPMADPAADAARHARAQLVVAGADDPPSGAITYETLQRLGSPIDRCLMVPGDHPLLLSFTSGSTGQPKGVVHSHGGFPYQAAVELAFGADVDDRSRVAWVTDFGWIVGSLLLYAPLALGGTSVLTQGHPAFPTPDRLWSAVEVLGLTHLGVSPTLIRTLVAEGSRWVDDRPMQSLRCVLSTGEPLSDDTWRWMHEHIGRGLRPVLNVTGGTEIGGSILSGCIAATTGPPGFTGPTPGMRPEVVDANGTRVIGEEGDLILRGPWPGRTTGFWNDDEGYLDAYWRTVDGAWWHGDRAIEHADGTWEVLGRSDDVIKIAGRRIGPGEYEAIAAGVAGVALAAATAVPHERSGSRVVVAVVPTAGVDRSSVAASVAAAIERGLGRAFAPSAVLVVDALPLTHSGKVHRRAMQSWIACPDGASDPTVVNPEVRSGVRDAAERPAWGATS